MSAESGMNTFGDSNGVWEEYGIEDVARRKGWGKNGEVVEGFYKGGGKNIVEGEGNAGEEVMGNVEDKFDVDIISENIDDLDERGGRWKVIDVDGNMGLRKS